jgi:hypothetical protein
MICSDDLFVKSNYRNFPRYIFFQILQFLVDKNSSSLTQSESSYYSQSTKIQYNLIRSLQEKLIVFKCSETLRQNIEKWMIFKKKT